MNEAKAIYKDELVITDANGRRPRTLVWLGPWKGDPQIPAWSPDGKRLVFLGKYMTSKTNGTGCICRALYVINSNGNGLRRPDATVRYGPADKVDWSPDGTTILFRTHPGEDLAASGYGGNLYTIHPDGTGARSQLTHFPSSKRVVMGSYSPDGTSIVFETNAGALGPGLTDIFEMSAEGTGLRQITRTRNFEGAADWGSRD